MILPEVTHYQMSENSKQLASQKLPLCDPRSYSHFLTLAQKHENEIEVINEVVCYAVTTAIRAEIRFFRLRLVRKSREKLDESIRKEYNSTSGEVFLILRYHLGYRALYQQDSF